MIGEDHLLAKHAVHFRSERLIGVHEVDATLIGQRRGGHCLFVESGDHGTVDVLWDAEFRIGDAKLQGVGRFEQTVGTHFIWIADARPEVRIGLR
ncbi:MAG TPA: hypothetical protein VLK82_12130 [Candidatus Tectomicrobia bacterium]|nr:hypothetical protein [Candidatus Tectomicrobia bacterium]